MSENDPAEHIIFIDRTRSSTTSLGNISFDHEQGHTWYRVHIFVSSHIDYSCTYFSSTGVLSIFMHLQK
jgi:hypothetical protein